MPQINRNNNRSGQQDQDRNSRSDDKMTFWTKVVGVATVCLVISTIISTFFIYQQWRVANDAQVDTRQQLRAVVGISNVNWIASRNGAGPIENYIAVVNFQNYGTTRTSKFTSWVSLKYFQKVFPNSQDFSKPYLPVETQYSIIAPNGASPLAVSIPADDVDRALNKEGVIVFWSNFEYADVFNPERVSVVQVCMLLDAVGRGPTGEVTVTPRPYRADCNKS